EKLGADRLVRPEKEMGERVARQLISPNIADYIEIDAHHSIVEVKVPNEFVGQSIKDLALRSKYGMNVLGIRKKGASGVDFNVRADYVIEASDQMLVIADDSEFKKFRSLSSN
ncbi:MAG: TrkA family potassium uptake protein, partial [Erysipelotrichaceae bacterium]|nr:TrkA family potassium uptake protein [Erysipelotrichaceae bacterium]